jgi:hypothetical protein
MKAGYDETATDYTDKVLAVIYAGCDSAVLASY